jgi:hypothetical protein
MSLSARITARPSRHLAWAQLLIPLIGALVAAAPLWARWPTHRVGLLLAVAGAVALATRFGSRRLRGPWGACRLTVSDRPEFDVLFPPAAIDGNCRLVESTVVWPGLWMLALQPEGSDRVRRLAFVPAALPPDARRALARFLSWSMRARLGGPGVVEKSAA